MKLATKQLLDEAADRYMADSELNGLLKRFIARKVEEQSAWAELTKATHTLFGGTHPHIEEAAAVTEMLLLALDIVDDLQDGDNPEMPWLQCGHAVALNAILSLVFASVGELARLNGHGSAPNIDLQVVSQLVAQGVRGQQLDISHAVETEQDYIEMISAKSGSMLRLACYIGYAAAGLEDTSAMKRMEELALTIGIIIQIRNDVRDITRWDLKNDLLHKKKTLPVLFLLTEEAEEAFEPLLAYYEGRLSRDEFLLHKHACLTHIERSGCLEYAAVIEKLFRDRAEELLAGLGRGPAERADFLHLTLGAAG